MSSAEVVSGSRLSSSEFPDLQAARRLSALVGVKNVVEPLARDLEFMVQPDLFKTWAQRVKLDDALTSIVLNRAKLAILGGDVGTGKTEICETIGDVVARSVGIPITLFRLGLQSRGSGFVGEMTKLISDSFEQVAKLAARWGQNDKIRAGGIFFIDEADALAQSRELGEMHHEDRAGVNALIRGIDDLRAAGVPVAVLMATNRIESLDPAVRRRAGRIFKLDRPTDMDRAELFRAYLSSLHDIQSALPRLVELTGPNDERAYGFTYSDILQRLLPQIVMAAYPESVPSAQIALQVAAEMIATPPFRQTS